MSGLMKNSIENMNVEKIIIMIWVNDRQVNRAVKKYSIPEFIVTREELRKKAVQDPTKEHGRLNAAGIIHKYEGYCFTDKRGINSASPRLLGGSAVVNGFALTEARIKIRETDTYDGGYLQIILQKDGKRQITHKQYEDFLLMHLDRHYLSHYPWHNNAKPEDDEPENLNFVFVNGALLGKNLRKRKESCVSPRIVDTQGHFRFVKSELQL